MLDSVRCVILRGGTSKGIYLKESDLPTNSKERDRTILEIFGSPDKRQINGFLGGADPLTSKVCVIGPPPVDNPKAKGAQLTYTFGQVEIDKPEVDYHSLCGNLTSGVGVFAIWEQMVEPTPQLLQCVFTTQIWIACCLLKCPLLTGNRLKMGISLFLVCPELALAFKWTSPTPQVQALSSFCQPEIPQIFWTYPHR